MRTWNDKIFFFLILRLTLTSHSEMEEDASTFLEGLHKMISEGLGEKHCFMVVINLVLTKSHKDPSHPDIHKPNRRDNGLASALFL